MSDYLLFPGELKLTTPFEDWCQDIGVHPETFGAWEQFCARIATIEVASAAKSA